MKRKPRWLLRLAAVVAVITLVFGWRPVAVYWVLYNLKAQPEYFVDILGSPASSIRGEALRKFARTDRGRALLFDAFLRHAKVLAEGNLQELTTLRHGELFVFWAGDDKLFHTMGEEVGYARGFLAEQKKAFNDAREIQFLFGRIRSGGHRTTGYPTITFSFRTPKFTHNQRPIESACFASAEKLP